MDAGLVCKTAGKAVDCVPQATSASASSVSISTRLINKRLSILNHLVDRLLVGLLFFTLGDFSQGPGLLVAGIA